MSKLLTSTVLSMLLEVALQQAVCCEVCCDDVFAYVPALCAILSRQNNAVMTMVASTPAELQNRQQQLHNVRTESRLRLYFFHVSIMKGEPQIANATTSTHHHRPKKKMQSRRTYCSQGGSVANLNYAFLYKIIFDSCQMVVLVGRL